MQLKLRLIVIAVLLSVAGASAQSPAPKVTTPEQFFGHKIGDVYVLPNDPKFTQFLKKLDAKSDRIIVQSIAKADQGRDQLMAIVTAPENHNNLQKYNEISRPLALPEGVTADKPRPQR